MSTLPPPPRAVFLSYAHEDGEAARQLADALRAAGVEVWFDQNELRGGDAWDAMIRRQIKECALFVPIVSAHTQVRREGYFRVEWKLAAQRTYAMADGTPFLMPVTIDGTRDSDGLVPPEFKSVQWTRLAGSDSAAAFVGRIISLLGPAPAGAQAPAPVRAASIPVSPGAVAGKSIAVLPFANSSPDPENAFFADGVHEDLLTHLAMIRDLRVVSRTSVLQYRGTTKSIGQIGQELKVDYVLEGSVRRAGNKVRVTGQLIRAASDEHVWAKNYDRDLTDVFALQSELATAIAGALQAVLSPQTAALLERRPTHDVTAYDEYMRARDFRNKAPIASRVSLREGERLYTSAVQRDPNFAEAWGELAVLHALNVFWGIDASPARLAAAEGAIAQAHRSAPDLPAVISATGTFAYYAHRDYARATAQFEKLARLQPNDPTVFSSLGLIQRRQGRWAESLANLRRALELDPGSIFITRTLLSSCQRLRRWDDCRILQRRLVELVPESLIEKFRAADLEFDLTGSKREFRELLARLTPEQRESPHAVFYRKFHAFDDGDFAEFKRLDQQQPYCDDFGSREEQAISAGLRYLAKGETEIMAARIAPYRAELRDRIGREPTNFLAQANLGMLEAMQGNGEEALRLLHHAEALMPYSKDAVDGIIARRCLAQAHAVLGHKDAALAELEWLLQRPATSAWGLKESPAYANLRGDPRFEAMVNDPRNLVPWC